MPDLTVTILDLPEILAIVEEAIDAVPTWERPALRDRLDAVVARARRRQEERSRG